MTHRTAVRLGIGTFALYTFVVHWPGVLPFSGPRPLVLGLPLNFFLTDLGVRLGCTCCGDRQLGPLSGIRFRSRGGSSRQARSTRTPQYKVHLHTKQSLTRFVARTRDSVAKFGPSGPARRPTLVGGAPPPRRFRAPGGTHPEARNSSTSCGLGMARYVRCSVRVSCRIISM